MKYVLPITPGIEMLSQVENMRVPPAQVQNRERAAHESFDTRNNWSTFYVD